MRAWANVKTQEKNVISSLLYIFSKSNTFEKKSTTFCFVDDFWAGVGFNGINALASHVVTVLKPYGTLWAGFIGINALAIHVLMALQPFGTLLSRHTKNRCLSRKRTTSAVYYSMAVLYSKDRIGMVYNNGS